MVFTVLGSVTAPKSVIKYRLADLLLTCSAEHEITLKDVHLIISDSRVLKYFGDKWSFRVLRGFLEQVGLKSSPELHGFGAAISAQERALASGMLLTEMR